MKKQQAKRVWSDTSMLRAIPNPSRQGYEIKIKNPEVTFLGATNQPDFATVYLTVYPGDSVVELKSLKMFFHQFRSVLISYERLINVVYDDLMSKYKPARLRIVMTLLARGGISSRL
ncbi:MAG: 7-cyano-7-deazaguanine reductase, partial [Bacteroidetes bacterium RIFCSPHIGHO2_02_FULL_44_7]